MADSVLKRAKVAPCGTYSGYQRHKRTGEELCEACREASQAYFDEYRARPGVAEKARLNAKAQQQALMELSHAYPHHYRELYLKYQAELLAEQEDQIGA